MKRSILCVAVMLAGVNTSNAAIVTADVAVYSPGGQYARLEVDQWVFTNWNWQFWYDIPNFAKEDNFLFWQVEATGTPAVADGMITFEVLTDGPVLMACSTRTDLGGNPSGDWVPYVTTPLQFAEQGWVEFARGLLNTSPNLPYVVLRRDSVAGEVFTYRNEKYLPPLIILSETTTKIVPEPTAIIVWSLLGALAIAYGWYRKRNA